MCSFSWSAVASGHHESSKAAVFAHENRQAIMDRFADFQTNVCSKLLKNGVDTEEFRLYVIHRFPPGECIPPPPANLMEVFKAITHHGLWDYYNYSPLVRIAKRFGAGDAEIERWVNTYKKDVKAYSIVAKLDDYIESDLDVTAPPAANRAKYDPRYFTPVEWKTEFIDHSLQYLTEVWELFSSHYLMPDSPPTALLDSVREGCYSVTWLVLSDLIPQFIKRVKSDATFFQQHRILRVTVRDECIYEKEDTSVSSLWGAFGVILKSQSQLTRSNDVLVDSKSGTEPTEGFGQCQFSTFGLTLRAPVNFTTRSTCMHLK